MVSLGSVDTEVIAAWLRQQIRMFKRQRVRYVRYAEVLRAVLARAAEILSPNAIVQSRAKSLASFAEKALRKRGEFSVPAEQFTDLCGARVIVNTPDEIDRFCAFIEKHFIVDWPNSLDASERLGPSEFGYRSVHRIVQFKPGVFPNREIAVEVPREVYGLKAEIQIRTMLQHAHADFTHDRCYKGKFTIPDKWSRDIAAMAALLEQADKSFARILAALQAFALDHRAYLSTDEIREQIRLLGVILESDPHNSDLAVRIAQLAITIGEWQKAIDILQPYRKGADPRVLGTLGVALCRQHWHQPMGPEYQRGQEYLASAYRASGRTVDAIAAYAGALKHAGELGAAREL